MAAVVAGSPRRSIDAPPSACSHPNAPPSAPNPAEKASPHTPIIPTPPPTDSTFPAPRPGLSGAGPGRYLGAAYERGPT
eukprot:2655461-Rhodomonas_salina.1